MTTLPDLAEIKRRWLDQPAAPAENPDPIIAAFDRRNLPANAQLRQWYADANAAAAVIVALDQTIADAEQQIQQLVWHARTLKPDGRQISADTPLPTAEQASAYAAVGAHAELLQHYLERYRALRGDTDRKRADAERIFNAARAHWAELIYHIERDASYAPRGALLVNNSSAPNPFELQNLKAALAAMER